MFELAVKAILAHIMGDFVLQSDKAVADIQQNRIRSPHFYIHFGIHWGLLWLTTGLFLWSLLVAVTHITIDFFTKIKWNSEAHRVSIFIIDQSLHLLSIATLIYVVHTYHILWEQIFSIQHYLFAIAVILLTSVSAVSIRIIMIHFFKESISIKNIGNEHAGKLIGMLERLFIFGFIIHNFWEGIGFLLAAKSIFRFGDLKENKDVQLTEYILIGTLLSFGLAMLISIFYQKILHSI